MAEPRTQRVVMTGRRDAWHVLLSSLLVVRRANDCRISPVLDAPGCVLRLDAPHRVRLRCASLPDDEESSEIRGH